MFSFSWKGDGASLPTPASRSTLPHDATQNSWFASCGNIKSPTYSARPNKTCDVLLYTILFLDVSSIDHVLMGRRKEKIKDEGRRRVECLDENSFFFPNWWQFGEQLFSILSEAIHQHIPIRLVLLSFSLLFTIYMGQTLDGAALTCTRAGDDANSRDYGAWGEKKSLAQRRRHGFLTRSIRLLLQ